MSISNHEPHLVTIKQWVAAGHLDAASAECARLIETSPRDPRVWKLAADIASRKGARAQALALLRSGLECVPGNPSLLLPLGQALLSTGQRSEALVIALELAQRPLEHAGLLDAIGTLITHCGKPGQGLACFERAVALSPDNPAFRYNLAMGQRMNGDLTSAEANLDMVLTANPLDGEAQNARSGLRKQTCDRNHVAELETALGRLSAGRGTVGIQFALAKELEDLGEYRRSFAHLTEGCSRFRASYQYDVGDDVAVLEALARNHTAKRLEDCASSIETDSPIFIIGLPRSGTTLVEQIIGSHGDVYSAGELDAFPTAMINAVVTRQGTSVSKLEFVQRSLEVDFARIGNDYLEAARAHAGDALRFTDKLPFNYLYAGLIHAALPRARFIALRRHPLDVCYAMYKTLFASAYPFTYDLIELARYYVAWDRLLRHWEESIGRAWLTVHYEDIVVEQEEQTRVMLEHCGLTWDARCLHFQDSPKPVATASAVQVRSPLYTDSVGKWRAYAHELKPLMQHLEDQGIACNFRNAAESLPEHGVYSSK